MAPFRECYGRLHELRSLAPKVNLLTLTATASKGTKDVIINILGMQNAYVISESPGKPNIKYIVEYMPRDSTVEQYFTCLVNETQEKGIEMERTIHNTRK